MPKSCAPAIPSTTPNAAAPTGCTTNCPAATSNGPFRTRPTPPRAALNSANPQSIHDNLEYSGLIYKGTDGKYYYSGPAKGQRPGGESPCGMHRPLPARKWSATITPMGASLNGPTLRRARPRCALTIRRKDDFNSDNVSGQDKSDNNRVGYPGYLGTPSGTFRKYDPATGRDTTI